MEGGIVFTGMGVSYGVGIAQALIWQPPIPYGFIPRHTIGPNSDVTRFKKALHVVLLRNKELAQRTARRIGSGEASIFEAHCLLLEDDEGVSDMVISLIQKHSYTAEYAVYWHFNALAREMESLDNEYMRQRSEDFYSLRDQLIRELMGYTVVDATHFDRPAVVVAHALSPSDIANMDHSRLQGIVCETGGYSSHFSIIARTLGMPAVVGVEDICAHAKTGDTVALDGETGEVWLNPEQAEIKMLRSRCQALRRHNKQEQVLQGAPTVSLDGRRVELSANVGQPDEIDTAMEAGSESIGLYRTELLHLNRSALPAEEEQLAVYKSAIDKLNGKAITVRTLDVGDNSSKIVTANRRHANIAIGYRGIRMALGRPSLFRTQLRALLRASAFGNVKVMLPMVSSLQELEDALAAIETIKEELRRENIPFDEKMPVGVMIEIPAAVYLAPELSEKADFFTIGINDLIQFTLAADRGNPQLAYMYTVLHPAVLNAVRQTVAAAHKQGIPCNLCGEVKGQEQVLPLLLGMNLDGFSLNPRSILPARQILNSCNYAQCQELAQKVLKLHSTDKIEQALHSWANENMPKT